MPTINDMPEHVLHDVLSVIITSTTSSGWQLSLRLVNRQFNEAVLHVYFLRERFIHTSTGHSPYCVNPCHQGFCEGLTTSKVETPYAARFIVQSLLTSRHFSNDIHSYPLLRHWKTALTMMQVRRLKSLDRDQAGFFSTCSNNPIFNDIPSASLSEAIESYIGLAHLKWVTHHRPMPQYILQYQVHPPAFWVALSACVLGDLQLLDLHIKRVILPAEKLSSQSPPTPLLEEQPVALLTAAVRNARTHIIKHLFTKYSHVMAGTSMDHRPLQEAIYSRNNVALKVLLESTPKVSSLLATALHCYSARLPRSSGSSEAIRLLAQHFAPLSAKSRTWLILQSCAIGDVALLEEFSKAGPPLSQRLDGFAVGYVPTYLHFAIRSGNIDSLRFLLDHGVGINEGRSAISMATEQALSSNQIECYRELYRHFDEARSARYFEYLALADNAEDMMVKFISEHGSPIFQSFGNADDPVPSMFQRALWNAMARLRSGNVRFLLSIGVWPYPWQLPTWHESPWRHFEDPFKIKWSYFNQNQDAFLCTQAVLDAFDLSPLQVAV